MFSVLAISNNNVGLGDARRGVVARSFGSKGCSERELASSEDVGGVGLVLLYAGFTFPLSDPEARAPGEEFNLRDPVGTTPVQKRTAQTAAPEGPPALPAIVMRPLAAETGPSKKLGEMNLEPNSFGLTTYKASGLEFSL